jgi:DNA polymerase
VLGLGYGTGAVKLRQAIKVGSGKDIGEEDSKRIVNLYRSAHPKVTNWWYQGQQILDNTYNGYGGTVGGGSLKLQYSFDDGIILPSGLRIRYSNLQKKRNGEKVSYVYGKDETYIYGPKVAQNITQAVARCVMAEAMPRIAKRYRIVLTVHDALYCIAPEAEGKEALDFMVKEMTTAPDWAWGLPLGAEGAFGKTLADLK